jgi:glutathione S-transferase
MDEITLHQPLARSWGSPNASPFCSKLETYLRMAEVPHKLAPMKLGQAPKGKIPYVHMDGKHVGDSQLILEEIERRLGDKALDAGLSPRDIAIARLTRRTLEEGTYFVAVLARWKLDTGFSATRTEFKKFVPGIVVGIIRRAQTKKLQQQGTGRHTPDEAMAMGAADFAAVAELLGDKPFFFGERPRTIDATVFAFVEGILGFPVDSPLKAAVQSHANLVAYRQRVRARWFSDLG